MHVGNGHDSRGKFNSHAFNLYRDYSSLRTICHAVKFLAWTAPKHRDLRPARRKVFASNAA